MKDLIEDIIASFGEDLRKRHWCVHRDRTIHIPSLQAGQEGFVVHIDSFKSYAPAKFGATLLVNQDVLVCRSFYRAETSNTNCYQNQVDVVNLDLHNTEILGTLVLFRNCTLRD